MEAPQSPSFEGLPRYVVTASILPYVVSDDWLNFRAASRGCYQMVHDTANVWHSSDRTYAPIIPCSDDAASGSYSSASNNSREGEALWRSALARDYQFGGGGACDECLQSIHSPVFSPNDDGVDRPFLSARNMFTCSLAFISWKHWRKIDICFHQGVPGMLSGPFFLRAGRMWRKIEDWCDRSGEYGRFIKSSLCPGRPFFPLTSESGLSAFQAVYAFYAGQHDDARWGTGLFGGYQAYDIISSTRWVKPETEDLHNFVVVAQGGEMKTIVMQRSTGQVYSISRQNPRLVATPCPGGVDRVGHPVNIADGKDSILRWFEEYARRLHLNHYEVGILNPQEADDGNDNADAIYSLLKYPTVNDAANCSRAVTRGVEVVASAIFVEEICMFVYSIRMRLLTPDDGDGYMSPERRGFDTCQLVSRHWKISKLEANRQPVIDEVRGEGVIGYFPILSEGAYVSVLGNMQSKGRARGAFSYQSCTGAEFQGSIEGYLQFRPDWGDDRPSGEIFNARVDPFPLTYSHFLY